MKRISGITLLSLFSIVIPAQTFWTEDFGEGECLYNDLAQHEETVNGQWEVTETGLNEPQSNVWYRGPQEAGGLNWGDCGTGCWDNFEIGNSTLHLSSDPLGNLGANYVETGFNYTTSDIRAETPIINCSGKSSISVKMDYLSGGIPGSDFCSVEYFDGTEWFSLGVLDTTGVCSEI